LAGSSEEKHCAKLKDESIGLVLYNTVYVKMKSYPERRCWLVWT